MAVFGEFGSLWASGGLLVIFREGGADFLSPMALFDWSMAEVAGEEVMVLSRDASGGGWVVEVN